MKYLKLTAAVVGLTLIAGCATQQSKVNQAKEHFRRGDLGAVSVILDEAIPDKNNVYYLERGTIVRLMGPAKLNDSSRSLLIVDQFLRQNELAQTTMASSLSTLGSYLISEGVGKDYQLKGYEGSLLAYHLALNHVLQGNWDNGRVEIMKMVKRESDLAEFNQKKYQALEAERQKGISGMAQGSMVDNRFLPGNPIINGYPVNTLISPEVNNLRNSYQSAAAHYLAGFIFEQQQEASMAAPGYRQAIELRPDLPFLKDALNNVDANTANGANKNAATTDTLFVVETGFLPFIDSFKVNLPIPTGGAPKIVTITYPVIQPNTQRFFPNQMAVDNSRLAPQMVTNIDAMARRDLKDEMPGYMLRGTTRAITSILAQVAAERAAMAASRNSNQAAAAGLIASLVTGITLSAINSADVRHWSSLPANIFMARAQVPNGQREFTIQTPSGVMVGRKIQFNGNKAVVYVRMFDGRASIMSSTDSIGTLQAQIQPIASINK